MTFVDELGPVFLGLHLYSLLTVIDEQGSSVLEAAEFPYPSRIASTFIVLYKEGPCSLTEIGKLLGMPHQLVSQRAKIMRESELIEYIPDANDARKTYLALTKKGNSEAKKLFGVMTSVAEIYDDIFDEIGMNLFDGILAFRQALERDTLKERLATKAKKNAPTRKQ